MSFSEGADLVGRLVDAIGVLVIAGGIVLVTVAILVRYGGPRGAGGEVAYRDYRRRLGKVILLGLELLVAADIIRTVAVTPTIESVLVLALIVLVRTFLSFSLEVELYGRWPWQRGASPEAEAGATSGPRA